MPSASCAVTVIATTPDFPNLPAGMTLVSDVTFDAPGKLPPSGSFDPNTRWQRVSGPIDIGSGAAVGCPSGPYGDTVLRGKFALNFNNGVGVAPFSMDMQFGSTATTVYREVYYKLWLCYQSGWMTQTDSIQSGRGHKFAWWQMTANSVKKGNHFWAAYDFTPPTIDHRFQFVTQPAGGSTMTGRTYRAGTNGNILPDGAWHQLELYTNVGSPGATGTMQAWLDQVLVLNRTNIEITPADMTAAPGYRGIKWNPTWSAQNCPQTQYISIARWAVYIKA